MSKADELQKLVALRDSGVLDEIEFQRLKVDLIGHRGPRRLFVAASTAVVLAVAVTGIAMKGSGRDSSIQTGTTEPSEQTLNSTTTTASPTTPPLPTTTTEPLESIRTRLIVQAIDLIIGIEKPSIFLELDALRRGNGPAWAPNGASDEQITECALDRVKRFLDLDNVALASWETALTAHDGDPAKVTEDDLFAEMTDRILPVQATDRGSTGVFALVCAGFGESEARKLYRKFLASIGG